MSLSSWPIVRCFLLLILGPLLKSRTPLFTLLVSLKGKSASNIFSPFFVYCGSIITSTVESSFLGSSSYEGNPGHHIFHIRVTAGFLFSSFFLIFSRFESSPDFQTLLGWQLALFLYWSRFGHRDWCKKRLLALKYETWWK